MIKYYRENLKNLIFYQNNVLIYCKMFLIRIQETDSQLIKSRHINGLN